MRNFITLLIVTLLIISCGTSKTKVVEPSLKNIEKPVVISNDSLEYKIIILDIGFNNYLNTIAKPIDYYSQHYLENKNIFYVTEWNIRANNPLQYGDLYDNQIEYSPLIDYGLEVNYKLFNYFQFFEKKYKVRLR